MSHVRRSVLAQQRAGRPPSKGVVAIERDVELTPWPAPDTLVFRWGCGRAALSARGTPRVRIPTSASSFKSLSVSAIQCANPDDRPFQSDQSVRRSWLSGRVRENRRVHARRSFPKLRNDDRRDAPARRGQKIPARLDPSQRVTPTSKADSPAQIAEWLVDLFGLCASSRSRTRRSQRARHFPPSRPRLWQIGAIAHRGIADLPLPEPGDLSCATTPG